MMRAVQFILIRRLDLRSFLIFLAINTPKFHIAIYIKKNTHAQLSDKLTIAEYNVTGSRVEQSPMAFQQHSLVRPIDDRRCELNSVPISTNETPADILLKL